jgi:dihydrodipicolinate synthase/N-acetylneuraminate lyase
MGTTGESPTVSMEEWEAVISTVVRVAGGRVPVIAGCGSNSTADTIKKTQRCKELGADAGLVVNPYYNKPNQDGLVAHFKAVDAVRPNAGSNSCCETYVGMFVWRLACRSSSTTSRGELESQ